MRLYGLVLTALVVAQQVSAMPLAPVSEATALNLRAPMPSERKETAEMQPLVYMFYGTDVNTEGYEAAGLKHYRPIFSPRLRMRLREGVAEKASAEVGDETSHLQFSLSARLLPMQESETLRRYSLDFDFGFRSEHRQLSLKQSLELRDGEELVKPFSDHPDFVLVLKAKKPELQRPLPSVSSDMAAKAVVESQELPRPQVSQVP